MFNWPYKHSHTKLLRLTSSLRQHSFIMFSSRADITISFGLCPPPPTPSPPSQHTGKKLLNLSDWQIWVPTAPIIYMLNPWVWLKCSVVGPTLQSLLAFVLPLLLPRPLLSTPLHWQKIIKFV